MPLNITATDVEKVASKLWGSAGLSGVDAVDLQVSCYDGSPTLSDFIIDQTDGIYCWNLTMRKMLVLASRYASHAWNHSTLELWSRGSSTVAVNCLSTELCLHQHIAGIISKQIMVRNVVNNFRRSAAVFLTDMVQNGGGGAGCGGPGRRQLDTRVSEIVGSNSVTKGIHHYKEVTLTANIMLSIDVISPGLNS